MVSGNFKVGDSVIVSNPISTYVKYMNVVGYVTATHPSMSTITTTDGRKLICYNNELQHAKDHIVHNLLKDL